MKQQTKKEIYKKIKNILKIKISNMHIFLCISFVYAFMGIIDDYYPHELYKLFKLDIYTYTYEYMFFLFLPLLTIFIFDFIIKNFGLRNIIAIKVIRILLIISVYVYFILFGFLNAVGKSMFT